MKNVSKRHVRSTSFVLFFSFFAKLPPQLLPNFKVTQPCVLFLCKKKEREKSLTKIKLNSAKQHKTKGKLLFCKVKEKKKMWWKSLSTFVPLSHSKNDRLQEKLNGFFKKKVEGKEKKCIKSKKATWKLFSLNHLLSQHVLTDIPGILWYEKKYSFLLFSLSKTSHICIKFG